MSGRIPRHFIDDLLARVDIVDLIDRHVPLKKAGANYVARCPFHSEKTPSFSVSRNKQFFHCFGCGASGNAIGFLMDFSHLDYVEAIEDLATYAGITVPRETSNTTKPVQSKPAVTTSYQLLEKTAEFYHATLTTSNEGKQAINYLQTRGVNNAIAQRFMLGYAPDDWRTLANRFDQPNLIEAGMAINKDGKTYDRFRARLMFPIRDKRARVIGFGGRVLDDSLPKYLNSPETAIFHKGNEVYGLYELLQANSKPERILVVEGYMDVIALASQGINNAVATLGTATSPAHMDLLFRFTSELVFCFDGDSAGQKASWRALDSVFAALKDGRQIRIMLLPMQHDPDSIIKAEGADNFNTRIQQSQPLSEYFFGSFLREFNLLEIEGRSQLINKARPYLEKLPQGVFREMMFARLQELSGTQRLDVSDRSAKLKSTAHSRSENKGLLSPQRLVMAILVQNPELIGNIEAKDINWNDLQFSGIELFKAIIADLQKHKPATTAILLEHYRNHPYEKIIKELAGIKLLVLEESVISGGLIKEFNGALDRMLAQAWATHFDQLMAKANLLTPSEKETLRKLLDLKRNGAF